MGHVIHLPGHTADSIGLLVAGGRLLIGDSMEEAGRLSEVAYDFLADDLARSGVFLIGAEATAAAVEGIAAAPTVDL